MSQKYIAVENMTIDIVPLPPTTNITATITITGIPSTKVHIDNNFIYVDNLSIQLVNITADSATIPDAGPKNTNFNSTALKMLDDNIEVLRVDDETDIISATPQIPGSPPVPYPITFKLKITNPNQDKVLAD